MPLILVKKSFRYAIGGNRVVEFTEGVHSVSADVADVAIKQLKVATSSKAADQVLPAVEFDVNGDSLDPDHAGHLDKTFQYVEVAVGSDTGTDVGSGADIGSGTDTGAEVGAGADIGASADTGAEVGASADIGAGADTGAGAE